MLTILIKYLKIIVILIILKIKINIKIIIILIIKKIKNIVNKISAKYIYNKNNNLIKFKKQKNKIQTLIK